MCSTIPSLHTSLPHLQYDDLMDGSDKLLRKLANEQMGPVLEAMGVTEDPFDFFVDLLKVTRTNSMIEW